jgi:hypothetical protein
LEARTSIASTFPDGLDASGDAGILPSFSSMKILLSTYSCFPCQTSEPAVAWRAVIADAHHYRELTEPELRKNPRPNFHPVFHRLSPAVQWLSRRSATSSVYYHLWQENIRRAVRELHTKIKFDLVHHLT